MFESKGKRKAKQFVEHISALVPLALTNVVGGFDKTPNYYSGTLRTLMS